MLKTSGKRLGKSLEEKEIAFRPGPVEWIWPEWIWPEGVGLAGPRLGPSWVRVPGLFWPGGV